MSDFRQAMSVDDARNHLWREWNELLLDGGSAALEQLADWQERMSQGDADPPAIQYVGRCEVADCSYVAKTCDDLFAHLEIHISDTDDYKDYRCTVGGCGKPFKSKGELKQHARFHSPDKPHHCTIAGCGKSFKSKGGLKRHAKVHSTA